MIPILVGGARLPTSDELPSELQSLATATPLVIHDASFETDVKALALQLLDSSVGATILQTALCDLFNFTMQDIVDNRRGTLSSRQIEVLGGKLYLIVGVTFVVLIALLIAGVINLVFAHASICFVGIGVLMAFIFSAFTYTIFNSFRTRSVLSIDGAIFLAQTDKLLTNGASHNENWAIEFEIAWHILFGAKTKVSEDNRVLLKQGDQAVKGRIETVQRVSAPANDQAKGIENPTQLHAH